MSAPGAAETVTNRQLLLWMFRFLAPVKLLIVIAAVWLLLSIYAEVLTTRWYGKTMDAVGQTVFAESSGMLQWFAHGRETANLRQALMGLCAIMGGFLVLRYLREVSSMKLSMTLVQHLRGAVYDKLQRVGFGFHDVLSTGQLINRALTDLQNVRVFLQTAVLTSLDMVLIVGGYIILLYFRSPWLALLSLAPLPIWVTYILRFSKRVQPASKAVMEAEDATINVVTETIAGVHVVKAFATQEIEKEKYASACATFYDRVIKRIRMYANFQPVIRIIGSLSHLSLFLLVSILCVRRELSVGDFLMIGAAMGTILGRLQQVAAISEQYQNAIVSARRLHEVLMARPTVAEKPDARPLPAGPGRILFEHVTFGYRPDRPVLRDVSFEAPGGSVVAIVGPTGSGKSTLVNLIARFYDPQQGSIRIDGIDVRDFLLDSLRPRIAFVFQETFLFSDTVAANIAYGRPGTSEGEIEAAARLAQAHEFIEQLPQGYNTLLGERGASLSGGQRQRLAIARAILQDPRILVLDDATAAVDPETDDLIHRAMRFIMRGRTTFLIAHRISTVRRADLVIVLEHGKVTELGTHRELMRRAGHYRRIAEVQLLRDDETGFDARGERPSHMDRMRNGAAVDVAAAIEKERSKAAQSSE
jgi:ATP-binding cassette subfamily B protein